MFSHKEQEKQEMFSLLLSPPDLCGQHHSQSERFSQTCQSIRLRHLNRYLEEAVERVGGIDPVRVAQLLLAIDLVKPLRLASALVEVRFPHENRQPVAHLNFAEKRFVSLAGSLPAT